MNILRLMLVMITGTGFGLGINYIVETEIPQIEANEYYDYISEGYCHNDGFLFYHMLDDLSDEDRIIVDDKIDEMLLSYNITIEELNSDFDLHYEFMSDLMEFLDDNNIDFFRHGHYQHHDEEDDWHHGMGR